MQSDDLQLINLIYTAPFDPSAWPGVLAGLAHETGALGTLIQAPSLPGKVNPFGVYTVHNFDAVAMARGVEAYAVDDPFSLPMYHSIKGRWGTVANAFRSCDPETIGRNPFWMEHLAGQDMGDTASLLLHEPANAAWPMISAVKRRGRGAFEDAELSRFQALAPHLRLAARLRHEASLYEQVDPAAAAALDHLPTACILLGAVGQVLLAATAPPKRWRRRATR